MLSAEELYAMRETVEGTFCQIATRRRLLPGTSDGMGGTVAGTPRLEDYPCRLEPVRARPTEGLQGNRPQASSQWTVLLPYDADVQPTDTLEIEGTVFQVNDTSRGRADDLQLQAFCTRQT